MDQTSRVPLALSQTPVYTAGTISVLERQLRTHEWIVEKDVGDMSLLPDCLTIRGHLQTHAFAHV